MNLIKCRSPGFSDLSLTFLRNGAKNKKNHEARASSVYKYTLFMREANEVSVLQWPPQSPDLNPIEHL